MKADLFTLCIGWNAAGQKDPSHRVEYAKLVLNALRTVEEHSEDPATWGWGFRRSNDFSKVLSSWESTYTDAVRREEGR